MSSPYYSYAAIIGNLTKSPEVGETKNGTITSKFTVAVNKPSKEKADFYDVTAFGKTAESCNEYLSKGKLVLVTGELDYGSWEDDKGFHSKVTIAAHNVQFLTPKADTDSELPE